MNIYDFDGTIYNGDSTVDFYIFLLRRHPGILLSALSFVLAFLRHKFGKLTTTKMKEKFFSFLPKIPDISSEVELFWQKNIRNIFPWYLKQKEENDLIISASPEFLLKKACEMLDIKYLIASEVDEKNGSFSGENCKGAEKVRRFREQFPDENADEFYSDSISDLPMAQLADKAFFISKGTVKPWKVEEENI